MLSICSDVSVACCSFGLSRNGSSHFDKVRLAFTFIFSEEDNSLRLVQLWSVTPGSGTENYPPSTSNSHEFGPPTHARVNCGKVVRSELCRCAVLKIARSKVGVYVDKVNSCLRVNDQRVLAASRCSLFAVEAVPNLQTECVPKITRPVFARVRPTVLSGLYIYLWWCWWWSG